MSFYFAGGAWAVWYSVLWLSLAPFIAMLVWLFARVSPTTAGEENTALNGSVIAAFFLLVLTSLVSVILYVRAHPSPTVWTYARWLALHFLGWTFLGTSIFFASLQALGAGKKIAKRRVSGLVAFVGALFVSAASLYATWYFRVNG